MLEVNPNTVPMNTKLEQLKGHSIRTIWASVWMFRPELYATEPRESPKRLCWVLSITLAIPSNRFGFLGYRPHNGTRSHTSIYSQLTKNG